MTISSANSIAPTTIAESRIAALRCVAASLVDRAGRPMCVVLAMILPAIWSVAWIDASRSGLSTRMAVGIGDDAPSA